MTVLSMNSWRIIFCMAPSVAESTDAVASSSTRMVLFFSRALPRQNSCLCPTLQFSPFSTTVEARAFLFGEQNLNSDADFHRKIEESALSRESTYLLHPTSCPSRAPDLRAGIFPPPASSSSSASASSSSSHVRIQRCEGEGRALWDLRIRIQQVQSFHHVNLRK